MSKAWKGVWLASIACAAFGQATARGAGPAYPTKPVRMILPFAAGGSTDMMGRAIAQRLTEQLGQPVIAENRPSAGGNVGFELGAKAPPDGYTITFATAGIAISPSLYARLGYDPLRDFAPITQVATMYNVMTVHNSVPAKTLKELIALARAHPGKLSFSSNGAGTTNHLAGEILKHKFKLDMVHVPYKGSVPGMVAVMSGEVDMAVLPVTTALPLVQQNRLRALAILADKRSPVLPQVPTSKEAGVDDYVITFWAGMLVPAATPRGIVTLLNAEIRKALASPDVKNRLATAGIEAAASTPEQFNEFIKRELVRFAKVIKDAQIRAE